MDLIASGLITGVAILAVVGIGMWIKSEVWPKKKPPAN